MRSNSAMRASSSYLWNDPQRPASRIADGPAARNGSSVGAPSAREQLGLTDADGLQDYRPLRESFGGFIR
jgi:hypothetical protein